MITTIYIIFFIAIIATFYLALPAIVETYLKYRGLRLITCPATQEPAAVKVDAKHAALTIFGNSDLRLKECSYWPERKNCGQQCLHQIEMAPRECLVKNIVAKWYEGKSCVFCHHLIGELNWHEHRPALLN